MRKNYYVILGIASDATSEEVKSAFRRRAMKLHPDTSGLETGPFLDVQEAYGVLSDPERRRRYDEQARSLTARLRPRRPPPESLVRERPKAEPFRAVEVTSIFRDVSITESFETYRSSFDELFDRWWNNFDSLARPKAERLESLTVECVVSPNEARRGGRIRVGIPARAVCSSCGGHGAAGYYECWRCEGRGSLTKEYPLELDYPPGIRDGYAMRISLTHYGIENFYLTLLIRVSGEES